MTDQQKIRELAQLIGKLQGDNDFLITAIGNDLITAKQAKKHLVKNRQKYINEFNKIKQNEKH